MEKKKNNTQFPPWNLVTYKTTCSKVSDNKVMKPENASMNEIRFQQNTVLYSWKEQLLSQVLPNKNKYKTIKNKLLNQNLSVQQQLSQSKRNPVPQTWTFCKHMANFISRVPESCTIKIKVSLSQSKSDEGTKILSSVFMQMIVTML